MKRLGEIIRKREEEMKRDSEKESYDERERV